MSNFSPLKNATRNFQHATEWLTSHGFELTRLPAPSNAWRVSRDQCVAEIAPSPDDTAVIKSYPVCLIGGEPAVLLDRGYQKFFQTSKLEVAATAERLHTLHEFSEALKEGLGYTSLYNEGFGSVSQSYQYDRVQGRESK